MICLGVVVFAVVGVVSSCCWEGGGYCYCLFFVFVCFVCLVLGLGFVCFCFLVCLLFKFPHR